MNAEFQKRVLHNQTMAWIAAMLIVAIVLVANRVFDNPSLILGPVAMMIGACFSVAHSQLQKSLAEIAAQHSATMPTTENR